MKVALRWRAELWSLERGAEPGSSSPARTVGVLEGCLACPDGGGVADHPGQPVSDQDDAIRDRDDDQQLLGDLCAAVLEDHAQPSEPHALLEEGARGARPGRVWQTCLASRVLPPLPGKISGPVWSPRRPASTRAGAGRSR
jgi:hypothetical protein